MSTYIDITNYEEQCSVFNSEKCQIFYNDSDLSKYYPICTQDEKSKNMYNPVMFKKLINNVKSKCYMNENDELCPLSIFRITSPNTPIDYPLIRNDTCKSKKCTDYFIEYLKGFDMEYFSSFEKINPNRKFSYEDMIIPKQYISDLKS
ncbi:hypothetical protein BCR36DRAFT_583133 [Piromyces finnis]|uniref:Uncharacterized protein n=1 Tax=Piromyces finnis TaxID=1754191 RepID=A0A1Y1VA81_9FUNG|nr:hypothetical protein BCR36DRAFT_583133 [Piromyces finnis]|eukprot:ORX51067.1 hypothetical protein BCR36DRAFT_583133 [Piromyces finnis]